MSFAPTAPNRPIQDLIDEGYCVELRPGYLLVHDIPYITTDKTVARGVLVCSLADNVGEVLAPEDHLIYFQGAYPCQANGQPIEALRNQTELLTLWEGFQVHHRFSNKPVGLERYPDHYAKVMNYIRIIANEAASVDKDATPRTWRVLDPTEESTVFKYRDTASSRADILAISTKTAARKVAIIGLGGTGSYIFDLVAKTPAREVHLFDGDEFLQHNAFRAPGAASRDELARRMPKVTYYAERYSPMRLGIIEHPYYVTPDNIEELSGFDFVFISVDRGPVRKLVSEFLIGRGIPFVDVGMEVLLNAERMGLFGTCRVTQSSPDQSDHFHLHAPVDDHPVEDLYRKAIQVADLNCLNAALAVIRWKQFCGFYIDAFNPHQVTFSVNSQSLTRDEMLGGMAG